VIARLGHLITLGGWAIAALIAACLAFGLVRFARLPRAAKRNYPAALWARFRWRWLTTNLQLAYIDSHRSRLRRPAVPFGTSVTVTGRRGVSSTRSPGQPARLRFPRARFRADEFGIIARVKTVPGVGRAEFDRNAPYIADAWRCVRVQVSQPKPGRVVVRGLRSDPLLMPLRAAAVPLYGAETQSAVGRNWRLFVGTDEWGAGRYLPLRGVTGITVAGLPGYGKTSLVNSWLCQLAGSPAVQFVIIDGKGAAEYDDWRDRSWIYTGDELPAAAAALEDCHALMRSRFTTSGRNAWRAGPTPEFPMVVTVIDEAHSFYDLDAVKGDRQVEVHVRTCRALTAQLVKKGRVALMLTIVMTQKQTGDAVPTTIRDNCPLAISFAVRTKEAAVAALGDGIREYPSYCPTGLQDPAYTGVCTASLRTGMSPFVRVRVPEITEQAAAQRAAATAHLRADPVLARLKPLIPDGDVPARGTAVEVLKVF
jgi:DNA segregation ATPase FtsK/SpoIIIE, S-DNA-T family